MSRVICLLLSWDCRPLFAGAENDPSAKIWRPCKAIGPSSNMFVDGISPKMTMPITISDDQRQPLHGFSFDKPLGSGTSNSIATTSLRRLIHPDTDARQAFLGIMKLTGPSQGVLCSSRQGSADGAGVEKGERAYLMIWERERK